MISAKTVAWTLGLLALAAVALGLAIVFQGRFDVASTTQHRQWIYGALERTMRNSVQRQAHDLVPPDGFDAPDALARGAACYRDHCVQCHGAPGVARNAFAMGLQPVPDPLEHAGRAWHPRELYWIARHGIKMSGMPAWEFRLPDGDLWALAGFISKLPQWSPQDYAARIASVRTRPCPVGDATRAGPEATVSQRAAPNRERGRLALYQYACNACHTIPGVVGSARQVGPPLEGFARRQLIAGKLANKADALVDWLRDPQAIDPLTAMPNLGVSERDARDMAAYLGTLQ